MIDDYDIAMLMRIVMKLKVSDNDISVANESNLPNVFYTLTGWNQAIDKACIEIHKYYDSLKNDRK